MGDRGVVVTDEVTLLVRRDVWSQNRSRQACVTSRSNQLVRQGVPCLRLLRRHLQLPVRAARSHPRCGTPSCCSSGGRTAPRNCGGQPQLDQAGVAGSERGGVPGHRSGPQARGVCGCRPVASSRRPRCLWGIWRGRREVAAGRQHKAPPRRAGPIIVAGRNGHLGRLGQSPRVIEAR